MKYYNDKKTQSEEQKHYMNLLCLSKKRLLNYKKKFPTDRFALKAIKVLGY